MRNKMGSSRLLLPFVLLLSCAVSFTPKSFLATHRARQRYSVAPTKILSSSTNQELKFLGKGPAAVVRPGIVLVAPEDEFHHFYRQAAIFVYAMGEDEDMDNEYVIRGAIIDHPTPFTLAEMAAESAMVSNDNPLGRNFIFRGGDKGGEGILMLHNQASIGNGEMIGTSGIFQGGIMEALETCAKGDAKPEDFKFFFNYCQFTEVELEQMLENNPWLSVEVPPDYVLDTDLDRGDCWRRLRNALREERDIDE